MTTRQIQWAKQHDWFRGTYTVDGLTHVQVEEAWVNSIDKTQGSSSRLFSDFYELYVWAGY